MGRVINPDSAAKQRTYLTKSIVLAIRHLMKQNEPDEQTRDLAAYIGLALVEINHTVEVSVQAWEKRGYWVKADRFRMEWEWTETVGRSMQEALIREEWATIAALSARTALRLQKITVAERNRIGTPWMGAWKQLQAMKN